MNNPTSSLNVQNQELVFSPSDLSFLYLGKKYQLNFSDVNFVCSPDKSFICLSSTFDMFDDIRSITLILNYNNYSVISYKIYCFKHTNFITKIKDDSSEIMISSILLRTLDTGIANTEIYIFNKNCQILAYYSLDNCVGNIEYIHCLNYNCSGVINRLYHCSKFYYDVKINQEFDTIFIVYKRHKRETVIVKLTRDHSEIELIESTRKKLCGGASFLLTNFSLSHDNKNFCFINRSKIIDEDEYKGEIINYINFYNTDQIDNANEIDRKANSFRDLDKIVPKKTYNIKNKYKILFHDFSQNGKKYVIITSKEIYIIDFEKEDISSYFNPDILHYRFSELNERQKLSHTSLLPRYLSFQRSSILDSIDCYFINNKGCISVHTIAFYDNKIESPDRVFSPTKNFSINLSNNFDIDNNIYYYPVFSDAGILIGNLKNSNKSVINYVRSKVQ